MPAPKIKITSEEEALAVLASVRQVVESGEPEFIDEDFPAQAKFIRDQAKRKAAKCTRRAGKSLAFGRILYKEAYDFPGSTSLYIALTKQSARNIMWKDVLKPLNDKLGLGADFNEATLRVTLPSGSEIYLIGMDSDAKEMEKLLGSRIRVAIIDEAGSFRVDLRKLVYENIEPALVDLDGYTILGGTPTEFTKGLFYDVTCDEGTREAGWSVHEWNTFQNPYMAEKWKRQVERLKRTNPRVEETPAYKRMYLGKWVVDISDLVYKFDETINTVTVLPDAPSSYVHVLGVDLGFNDASAFVVAAYSVTDRSLYFVDCHKAPGMIISDVAERIRYYVQRYAPYKIIVDNAAKQSVEELKQRYQLPLEPAEKQGKAEFIEIMNSELIQGRVKLLPTVDALSTEWTGLVWDKEAWEKKRKREEHPGCENHLCFVAGTPIRTPSGCSSIETLRVGDLVETRKGPRRIQYAISRDASVVELVLSNGEQLTCTPDHPFWSDGRWIAARDLRPTDALLSWNQAQELSASGSRTASIAVTSEVATSRGKSREKTSNAATCTATFGRIFAALSRMATTCTIRMATWMTTAFGISNACPAQTITPSILRTYPSDLDIQKTCASSSAFGLSQRLGTALKRGASGTVNTDVERCLLWPRSARGAGRPTKSRIWRKTKTVAALLSASPPSDAHPASMTSNGPANIATSHSRSTSTGNSARAPLHVRSISATTVQRVFNITVEDAHEYFAGDVLVSNCDAALYAWRHCFNHLSQPSVTKARPTAQEQLDAWEDRESDLIESEKKKPFWERSW